MKETKNRFVPKQRFQEVHQTPEVSSVQETPEEIVVFSISEEITTMDSLLNGLKERAALKQEQAKTDAASAALAIEKIREELRVASEKPTDIVPYRDPSGRGGRPIKQVLTHHPINTVRRTPSFMPPGFYN